MPWIQANGASLRYTLSGSGQNTLVLVHEAGGCLDSYDEALPYLEKHFQVLRYDQRGFGFSEKVRALDFEEVVRVTVWLSDLDDFGAFNGEYQKHFPDGLPARSTVQATLYKGARVEIEVQAWVGS